MVMKKRGAIELSIGTIVIIVLSMTLLILGMVLIRNIMCSAIIISDKISAGVENEIIGLFGSKDYEVRCMGEGESMALGDGGMRKVFCIINTDRESKYNLIVKNIESLKGVSTGDVKKWVSDSGWKGNVKVGQTTKPVLVLDIPRDVSATSLKIEVEENNIDTGAKETHILYIDVEHVGVLSRAIC